jgi:hypothetical protein
VLEDIQQIVDEVAEDLGRPVVLEDERHALIAHSPHAHSDAVRQKALFLRQTPPEAIAWVTREGLLEADGPLRIGPNAELGADSRVCTPVRDQGKLRGFLSVLDPDGSLDDSHIVRCAQAAEALARELHSLRIAQDAPFARERELIETLLSSSDATARHDAGSALVDEGRLSSGPLAVIVVRARGAEGDRSPAEIVAGLTQVIRRARHAFPARSLAAISRVDHVALLLSLDVLGTREAGAAAQRVADALAPLVTSGVLAALPTVAFADPAAEMRHVARAYRHAIVQGGGPVGWDQLGVYQSLVHVPGDELGDGSMDRRVLRLLGKPGLLRTLETYLELAGDAKRTAQELALHRTSLYYRLSKIEELAEVDLKSGADRLAAHLSIKALRLSGRLH